MMVEGPSASSGVIEVELSGGVRLRVGSDVDGAALKRRRPSTVGMSLRLRLRR
jgi:hypothetical protein